MSVQINYVGQNNYVLVVKIIMSYYVWYNALIKSILTNMYSYNNNRGQSFRSYNNPPNCYHCGQTGHMAWNCSMKQGNQRNKINSAIPAAPRPTNTVPPSTNT